MQYYLASRDTFTFKDIAGYRTILPTTASFLFFIDAPCSVNNFTSSTFIWELAAVMWHLTKVWGTVPVFLTHSDKVFFLPTVTEPKTVSSEILIPSLFASNSFIKERWIGPWNNFNLKVVQNTVQSLYKAMLGYHWNGLISKSCYRGTILQKNYRKMTISWSFSYYPLLKFHGVKI